MGNEGYGGGCDSDSDNNVASSISRTNDGFSGASAGFIKAGGSYRLTHNGTFSPKYYSSGWGGGSRGHIKTYNSIKIGRAISKMATPIGLGMSGYNLYGAYKSDGDRIGKNTKITATSEAGSWVGGIGGSAVGANIGTACCPGFGTLAGGIIGGIAGGFGGGKGGEKLGEKLFDE
jgi:hypothetical protein